MLRSIQAVLASCHQWCTMPSGEPFWSRLSPRVRIVSLVLVFLPVVLPLHFHGAISTVYHDPQHRFCVRLPDGWKIQASDNEVVGFVRGKNAVIVYLPRALQLELKLTEAEMRDMLAHDINAWKKEAIGKTWFSDTNACSFAGQQGLCAFLLSTGPNGKWTTVKRFIGRRLLGFLIAVDEQSAIPEVCQIEGSFSRGETPASEDVAGCVAEYKRVAAQNLSQPETPTAAGEKSSRNIDQTDWLRRLGGVNPSQPTKKAVSLPAPANTGTERPVLGITTLPIALQIARQFGLAADSGLLIQTVLPGSAAERAGLRGGMQPAYLGNVQIALGGDLIVGFDDQIIATQQDLTHILSRHRPGDRVTVFFYRGNQKMHVSLTLGEGQSAGSTAVMGAQPVVPNGNRIWPNALHWVRVNATDGTFEASLPDQWQVLRSAWPSFNAFSENGEYFRAGMWDIFADRQSALALLQGLSADGTEQALAAIGAPPYMVNLLQQTHAREVQQLLAASGLTAQDLELSLRDVLPPYSPPAAIISQLLPQIANGAIQNMRIMGVGNIAPYGPFRGALVAYQYTLVPRRGDAFAVLVAPSLMNYSQVPMRGFAVIYTLPPSGPQLGGNLAALNQWHCLQLAIEAPEALFTRSTLVYDKMFRSYMINPPAVVAQGEARQQLLASMHEALERSGHQWMLTLGGMGEYNTGSDRTPRPIDLTQIQGCPVGHVRQCQDGVPRCYPKLPAGGGCDDVRLLEPGLRP
jgi:hypothetical protein